METTLADIIKGMEIPLSVFPQEALQYLNNPIVVVIESEKEIWSESDINDFDIDKDKTILYI